MQTSSRNLLGLFIYAIVISVEKSDKVFLSLLLSGACWQWAEIIFGRKQGQKQKLEFSFDFNRYGEQCVSLVR